MKINGFEIDVKVMNNRKKYTLFSVHGMNSSMAVTDPLDKMDNNFNHIKISMPIVGKVTVDDLNGIVKEVLEKHIKAKHLVILGHSLGGVQVAFNHQDKKIEKVIYVAPFNPSVYSPARKLLAKTFLRDIKPGSVVQQKINKFLMNTSQTLKVVLDRDRPYFEIFKNYLFNKDFIAKLDTRYKQNKKETLYMIGSNDRVIDPTDFDKYVTTELNHELHSFEAAHNPFRDNIELTHKLINEFIPHKKLWFKRRIFK